MSALATLPDDVVRRTVRGALIEDLGEAGDVTSDAVIEATRRGRARLVAREELVVAGGPVAEEVFTQVDTSVRYTTHLADGSAAQAGDVVATVEGPARSLLKGERTALNFLMRMSGVATATREAVAEIEGTGARILDTRKTIPGLRRLDKYAVTCGGGCNHRIGLFDQAMIKDTHLAALDSLTEAVARVRAHGVAPEHITVEVRDFDQLREALATEAGRVMLDNMDPDTMREAVGIANGRVELEASGGLRPGRLRVVAETGVDCLSLGWITHSARSADLAMEMDPHTP